MRAISYVRVSSEEQVSGYSLDAQRRAIRDLCRQRGYDLVAHFADEGRSAHKDSLDGRPGIRAAIGALISKEADVIVVHKADRLARNLLVLLQILQQTGGGILAVDGDFDYSSPDGKLRAHILGSVAQWYSDNLSREVKKGKQERLRAGLWNGRLPFGLRKQSDDDEGRKPPILDDAPILCTIADRKEWSKADALLLIFERVACGTSLPRLAQELHGIGFRLGLGTLWEILTNRFYLGEVPVRDPKHHHEATWLPGAHGPLIDPTLFDRATKARLANRSGAANLRRTAHAYALTGLCRCERCGAAMHMRLSRSGTPTLMCHRRHKQHDCDQPYTIAEPVEQQCLAFLRSYTPPADIIAWLVEQVREPERDTRRERAAVDRQLQRLRDLYLWGDIAQADYTARRVDLERQRARLEPQATDTRTITRLVSYLRDLETGYQAAEPAERNAILREVFAEVVVDEGEVTRARLQPAFDGILRPYVADVFASSRQTDNVSPAVPLKDGWWRLPPPDISRRMRPLIPREYWPSVAAEKREGATLAQLAEKWQVSPRTIRRVVATQREMEG